MESILCAPLLVESKGFYVRCWHFSNNMICILSNKRFVCCLRFIACLFVCRIQKVKVCGGKRGVQTLGKRSLRRLYLGRSHYIKANIKHKSWRGLYLEPSTHTSYCTTKIVTIVMKYKTVFRLIFKFVFRAGESMRHIWHWMAKVSFNELKWKSQYGWAFFDGES